MNPIEPSRPSPLLDDFTAGAGNGKPGRQLATLASAVALAMLIRLVVYAWFAQGHGGPIAASCHFDCDFYMRIATSGYGVDSQFHGRGSFANWAYFPLFPLLVRALHELTGLPFVFCGQLVSAAGLALLAFAGALYLQRSRAGGTGFWLLTLFVAPYGFFFSVPYTESLFAGLVACVLLARLAKRPLLAAALAALAAASRPTGVLLSIIIIVDQMRCLWQRRHERPRLDMLAEVLPPLAIAPLGLTLFMAWQYWRIGDAFAFSHVQIMWDRRWLGPVMWIRVGLRMQDWATVAAMFPTQSYSYNASVALLGLGAAAWLALRRRFAEAWICAAAILLPLSSGLHSMPRFVGANPAFLFAVYDALLLLRRFSLILAAAILLLMALGQGLLLSAWYDKAGGLF